MNESILTSIKKTLGLDENYTAFDADIVLYINAVLSDLNQLGLGPPSGFVITGADETWAQFIGGDLTQNNIQVYVGLRLRLLFDPPESSYAITSFQEQINQLEWRIRERREEYAWTDPDPSPEYVDAEVVLDGGVG